MTGATRAAMVFGAGFGKRMAPLTVTTPKPLVALAGTTLLDRALAFADEASADPIVVNAHYLANQIVSHLAGRDVTVIEERPNILDTGGGLRNALAHLGEDPLFTLNPDAAWLGPNPLEVLDRAWRPDTMRALLLLVPRAQAEAHLGAGDFDIDAAGCLSRGSGFVYTGAQLIDPSGLHDIPGDAFSLNIYWDALDRLGGIHGVVYPGTWCDVGHPAGLDRATELLKAAAGV